MSVAIKLIVQLVDYVISYICLEQYSEALFIVISMTKLSLNQLLVINVEPLLTD